MKYVCNNSVFFSSVYRYYAIICYVPDKFANLYIFGHLITARAARKKRKLRCVFANVEHVVYILLNSCGDASLHR